MISIVVAMTQDRLIGAGATLPWKISSELQHFKSLTEGNVVVFGRRTYKSLLKGPLKNRINVMITSNTYYGKFPFGWDAIGCRVCDGIHNTIAYCHQFHPGKHIFICGGRSIYEQTLPFVDNVYLSVIRGNYEGDVYFPTSLDNLMKEFTIVDFQQHLAEGWDFYKLSRFGV